EAAPGQANDHATHHERQGEAHPQRIRVEQPTGRRAKPIEIRSTCRDRAPPLARPSPAGILSQEQPYPETYTHVDVEREVIAVDERAEDTPRRRVNPIHGAGG